MKYIYKSLILISIFVFLFNINNLNIKKEEISYVELKIQDCPYSKEYIEWLKLSKKDKEHTIMPNVCDDNNNDGTILLNNNLYKRKLKFLNSVTDTKYDLRNVNGKSYLTNIKNQGNLNTCWTFASLASLESHMLFKYNLTYDLSERHLEYTSSRIFLNNEINKEGYNRNINDGGNNYMTSSYYMNGKGPINESDMPYQYNLNLINLSDIYNNKNAIDVNEIIIDFSNKNTCTNDKINTIKNYIYNNGAVASSIYFDYNFYDDNSDSYLYNSTLLSNHAITIIGWDDNYSKSNFNNMPSSNGAWIVRNSYGNTFGKDGYIYVSYEDTNICKNVTSIKNVDFDPSDNTYYYDFLGYTSSIGNGSNTMYGANIFTKDLGVEILTEVTLATIRPSSYTIYINENNGNLNSSELKEIKSGTIDHAGYTTIKLDTYIPLTGNNFAIAVKYTTLDYNYPLPIQDGNVNTLYNLTTIENGKSFIGSSLNNMRDITQYKEKSIVSIKAGTNNVIKSNNTIILKNNYAITNKSEINNFLNNMSSVFRSNFELYNSGLTEQYIKGNIKTGMKLKTKGNNLYQGDLVILGDINKDGNVNMADVMKVATYVVDNTSINEEIILTAADLNNDNSVKMSDVMELAKRIVKGG